MSRENFAAKLTNVDGSVEYVMVSQIFRLKEVKATDKKPAHTLIVSPGGGTVEVTEVPTEIEKKFSAYGVMKLM